MENVSLSNHIILDDGDNPSDHLPILMTLTTTTPTAVERFENHAQPEPVLKWDKVNDAQKNSFTQKLAFLTDSNPPPDALIRCQPQCQCRESACHTALQAEYDCLIQCMKKADAKLPRHRPGLEKGWWTRGLTDLKNKSTDIHALWLSQGRPRHGPVQKSVLRSERLINEPLDQHNESLNKPHGIAFIHRSVKKIQLHSGRTGRSCTTKTKVIWLQS